MGYKAKRDRNNYEKKIFFYFFVIYSITSIAQEKDSLFFAIDKYYTISPTIEPNLNIQTRSELIETQKKQRALTGTNGYVYFIGDGILIKGLKPKKTLSIKDYIENRKFYCDGKYNTIVDRWKLEDSLTDKYEIFFVNGEEYIQPRYLEYISYHREGLITNPIKDTLCFTLDKDYIYQSKHNNDIYLFKEGKELYFKKVAKKGTLKPNKILNLESYIHSSKFYDNSKKKLNDFNLTVYLSNYTIFLINKKDEETEYFEISPVYQIE